MRDGEVMAFHTGHLLTLAWRAKKKKPVIMLSSESSAATEGATEDQIKPVVLQTSNIPQQAQLGGESSGDLLR